MVMGYVVAIFYLNMDNESFLDPMFTRSMYVGTYQYQIQSMNGMRMWPETTHMPQLPSPPPPKKK